MIIKVHVFKVKSMNFPGKTIKIVLLKIRKSSYNPLLSRYLIQIRYLIQNVEKT